MSIARARALRRNPTPQEARLWQRLRVLRHRGFHFRRQAPFRGYYLDFACFRQRLVVEIDGGQHGEADRASRDVVRDAVLAREGFRTLRFWNSELNENLDGVMEAIWQALQDAEPMSHPTRLALHADHPPHRGACCAKGCCDSLR